MYLAVYGCIGFSESETYYVPLYATKIINKSRSSPFRRNILSSDSGWFIGCGDTYTGLPTYKLPFAHTTLWTYIHKKKTIVTQKKKMLAYLLNISSFALFYVDSSIPFIAKPTVCVCTRVNINLAYFKSLSQASPGHLLFQ